MSPFPGAPQGLFLSLSEGGETGVPEQGVLLWGLAAAGVWRRAKGVPARTLGQQEGPILVGCRVIVQPVLGVQL